MYTSGDCLGPIFDSPCPSASTETLEVEGNLIVKGDRSLGGGGNMHIEGPCSDTGCRETGNHLLSVDGNSFVLKSSGPVLMEAGDSDRGDGQGSSLNLNAGHGTSSIGGSGGDIFLSAGNGAGGTVHHFHFSA